MRRVLPESHRGQQRCHVVVIICYGFDRLALDYPDRYDQKPSHKSQKYWRHLDNIHASQILGRSLCHIDRKEMCKGIVANPVVFSH